MSKTLYCIAQFQPKEGMEIALFEKLKSLEPDSLREDGCIYYRATKKIENVYATGVSLPFVIHEAWRSDEDFERHCMREEIVEFFENECIAEDGMVAAYNVTAYHDE